MERKGQGSNRNNSERSGKVGCRMTGLTHARGKQEEEEDPLTFHHI